jgi:hypothetical protein
LEKLKAKLQAREFKCCGTLQERAARLFLLKTTRLDKLPEKLLAKPTVEGTPEAVVTNNKSESKYNFGVLARLVVVLWFMTRFESRRVHECEEQCHVRDVRVASVRIKTLCPVCIGIL